MFVVCLQQIRKAGYKAPTPIQAQAWPVALQGRDLVAIAKTGSGKTCGFLLPGFMMIHNNRPDPRNGPSMLVLAPTRELAVQIKEEADKFGRSAGVRNTCATAICSDDWLHSLLGLLPEFSSTYNAMPMFCGPAFRTLYLSG